MQGECARGNMEIPSTCHHDISCSCSCSCSCSSSSSSCLNNTPARATSAAFGQPHSQSWLRCWFGSPLHVSYNWIPWPPSSPTLFHLLDNNRKEHMEGHSGDTTNRYTEQGRQREKALSCFQVSAPWRAEVVSCPTAQLHCDMMGTIFEWSHIGQEEEASGRLSHPPFGFRIGKPFTGWINMYLKGHKGTLGYEYGRRCGERSLPLHLILLLVRWIRNIQVCLGEEA